MFSPEEQQIEICLLKSNLEEIENDILAQRSALPALDAENELKYRETMSALRVVRSLNSEIERLKQENVRLTAKRMQLKRHCEDISRGLERARRNRTELGNLLKQEEDDTELEIRKYEDFLRDIAERFRKTRAFHNESQMRAEIELLNRSNIEFENEEKKNQQTLIELQKEFDRMEPVLPENLLDIIGKNDLDNKLKAQTLEYKALCEKREKLMKSKKNMPRYVLKFN